MSESFSWMFVDFIPLLYERRRVARQCRVEIWLNPSPLVESLNIKKVEAKNRKNTIYELCCLRRQQAVKIFSKFSRFLSRL